MFFIHIDIIKQNKNVMYFLINLYRQFRDAARERYFKNMNMVTYFHSSIADYYLGIWGGGNPKPFKYTEIQRHRFNLQNKEGSADRKVPVQPLVFYSKEGIVTRYNLRKVSVKLLICLLIKSLKKVYISSLESYHIIL